MVDWQLPLRAVEERLTLWRLYRHIRLGVIYIRGRLCLLKLWVVLVGLVLPENRVLLLHDKYL